MRKLVYLIVFCVIFLVSAAFAAYNMDDVTVNFYLQTVTLPLSAVIISAILIGLLMGVIVLLFSTLKLRYDNRRLRHRLQLSEQEINSLRMMPVKDTP
jgi:putative membrane protein